MQPTPDPLKSTQPNLTHWVGLVFRAWWVGLGYKFFFNSGSGWVWVIKSKPDPPIYIYIYIYYIINKFFLNNQLFLPSYIKVNINVYFVYQLKWQVWYFFLLNLIIIVIKKLSNPWVQLDPTRPIWVGLDLCDGLGWVGLNFFQLIMAGWIKKSP